MTRSLILKAPFQLEWEDRPTPALQEGHAVLRTLKTAVSVSSTLSEYLGNIPVSFPRPSGYESLAVVEETTDPQAFPVGMRVVDTYGHADRVLRPLSRLIPVPADIQDEVALLSILACDAFKGVYRARPRKGEKILVMGAGVMGLLTLWNLRSLGLDVDICDLRPERLDLARHLGANPVPGPVLKNRYHCGFECSGDPQAFSALQVAMLAGGRICVPSDGNWGALQLTRDFHQKELTILGSSDGMRYQDHARIFFKTAVFQQDLLRQVFDLQIFAEALIPTFESLAAGNRPTKILVEW